MITRAEAIRQVTKDDLSQTNDQIKNQVRARYGLDVGTNQIIEVCGSYAKRKWNGPMGETLFRLGNDFLRHCGGNRRLATQVINSVEGS